MNVYAELGVEPIINAAGTLTRLSGSLMHPEVVEAMAAASRSFVDMQELHLAAGQRIAALIGVPAAHVCACAAAGISLMAAACIAGSDRDLIRRLPDTHGLRDHFVVQRAHRNGFDQALLLAGGRFVEIESDAIELQEALHSEHVAGVYYTHAWFCTADALPLTQVANLAHASGVPVIVDAAAEVPPLANLSRFLEEGADLVTFSGGKAIRGPQSTGFILGRPDLIEACRLNDCPNMGVGRPMKTGKEDIVGLVKAIERYVQADHAAELALWEQRVAHVIEALGSLEHVRAWRQLPYGIGQQIPHAAVSWDETALGLTHAEAMRALLEGKPRIAVQMVDPGRYGFGGYTKTELRIHPHTLEGDQTTIVAQRLKELLTGD
jgi:uncharacterized pyridoxal phosphate-dependent enzyme